MQLFCPFSSTGNKVKDSLAKSRSHCWDRHRRTRMSKLTITTFLTLMAFLMWLKTEISSWFLFPVPAILMEAIGFESSECYSWVHWGFPKKQGLFGRRRERGFYKLCIVRQDQAASPFGWSKQETALIVGVGRGEGSKWRTTGSLLWFM